MIGITHDQTGGFFGVKNALRPIHAQLDLFNGIVDVVNTSLDALDAESTFLFRVYNLEGGDMIFRDEVVLSTSVLAGKL